jgi:hypothetical protein
MWEEVMLIRILLAAIALATLWGIHVKWLWIEASVLIFLAMIIISSIFVPYLGKVAIGTLVILLAMVIAFSVSAVFSSLGFHPVVSKFEVVTTLLIVALVGVASALLYTYADYSVCQLLGSLGIFVVPLFLHFYAQEARVQGAGLVMAILTAVPWLVGLAVGVAVRH